MLHLNRITLSFVIGTFLFCTGCATQDYVLSIDPAQEKLINESAVSTSMQAYKRVMIVPPSGDVGAQFEPLLAAAEREFIRRDLTLITPSVTARVVRKIEGKDESASNLSDVERALIMAGNSSAEAILQIGEFSQSDRDTDHWRYFATLRKSDPPVFREYTSREFRTKFKWSQTGKNTVKSPKWLYRTRDANLTTPRVFSGQTYTLIGRLIDVNSGEVVAGIRFIAPSVNFARDYTETHSSFGQVLSRSYDWDTYAEDREKEAISALFSAIADQIKSR